MSSPTDLGNLNTGAWGQLQDLAERLEAMWREQGSADLNVLLPRPGDPARVAYLAELIKTDLEIRWRRHQGVRLDWYVERFEELGVVSELSPRLIYEEFRVRQLHGDKPDLASYKRRFPRQFDEVHRLVEAEPVCTVASAVPTPVNQSAKPVEPVSSTAPGAPEGYRKIERIGTGSFGEVWRAEAPGGIPAAVKVIYRPLGSDADQHEKKAIDRIKKLRHPFLLSTQAYWVEPDGRLHIAMELADGTLRDRLKECLKQGLRGIPAEELLQLMAQAAQALDFVHSKGMFHRDIKPDNIMLSNGFAKVGDFSLVRNQDTLSLDSAAAGTLAYMGPECFKGDPNKKYGKYSDQYSLAVSYIELRNNRRPFPTRTSWYDAMVDAVEGTPDLGGFEGDERAVLERALSKTPEERYPSCLTFVGELEKAIKGAPDEQHPPGAGQWLRPGNRVGPEGYQLRHDLAIRGGVGQVWEAVAPGGKLVALQVIQNLNRGGVLKHLHAYDLARSLLDAPHVLQVHTKWLADAAGEVRSLAEVLKTEWKEPVALVVVTELPEDDVARCLGGSRRKLSDDRLGQLLRYLKQAALAIDHMNTRQHSYARRKVAIRHCAIRPENLWLIGDEVRLADFDLAQEASDASEPLRADPKELEPGYAAPELLERGTSQVTASSDQYSLAMSYVKLRTGSLPFEQSQSRKKIIDHQLEGRLNLDQLPERERAIIARATARKPEERYPSCAALIAALEEVCREPRDKEIVAAPDSMATLNIKQPTPPPLEDKKTPARGSVIDSRRSRQTDDMTLHAGVRESADEDSEFELHTPEPKPEPKPKPEKFVKPPRRHPSRWLARILAVIVAVAGVGVIIYVIARGLPEDKPVPEGGHEVAINPDKSKTLPPPPPKGKENPPPAPKDQKKPSSPEPGKDAIQKPGSKEAPIIETREQRMAGRVKAEFPKLGKATSYGAMLDEFVKAEPLSLDKLDDSARACWAECLLETGSEVKAAWDKIADLNDNSNAGKYGQYVKGMVLYLKAQNKPDDLAEALKTLNQAFEGNVSSTVQGPDWKNDHRKQKAAKAFAEGAPLLIVESKLKLVYLKQAVEQDAQKKYRLALAEAAKKAEPPEHQIAKEQADKILADRDIDILANRHTQAITRGDYDTIVLATEAREGLGQWDEALAHYDLILRFAKDKELRKKLPSMDAPALLKNVLRPAISAGEKWLEAKSDDSARAERLATLYAEKGRLIAESWFAAWEFKDPFAMARQAYEQASQKYPKQGDAAVKAKYLLWQGYLCMQDRSLGRKNTEKELGNLSRQMKEAAPESSGLAFLEGLALHYAAINSFGNDEQVRDRSSQAIDAFKRAIDTARDEQPRPEFLDLYFSMRSAANIIKGNYEHRKDPQAVQSYRPYLESARQDAQTAIDRKPRFHWFALLQRGNAQEDLAWLCEKDEAKRSELYDAAVKDFAEASTERGDHDPWPLLARGRVQCKRVVYSKENPKYLAEAEEALEQAIKTALERNEKGYLAEANMWLGLTCLHRGKDSYKRAVKALHDAIQKLPDEGLDFIVSVVMETEIQNAAAEAERDQVSRAVLFKAVRDQADQIAQKGDNWKAGIIWRRAQVFQHEGKLQDALNECGRLANDNSAAPRYCVEVLLLRNWLTLKIAKARDRDLSLPQPQCIDDADRALELVKKHHLDAVHRERAENRAGQARYFAGLVSGNQKWLEDATELLLNADKSRKDEIHRWEYRYYAWQCYLRLAVKFPGDPKRQLWIAEARKYAELVKDDEEADMEQRTQAANWLQ